MGTRHLICIYHEGKFELAKYCQWDGYPNGSGMSIVEYLTSDFNRASLIERLPNLKIATDDILKGIQDVFDANPKLWDDYPRLLPLLSRDPNGGDVYRAIQNSELGVTLLHQNSFMFGQDGLFCEWAYVLDLDAGTLEVYEGFKKTEPKSGKWAKVPKERGSEYYPIHLKGSIILEAPKEMMVQFMKDMDKEDKE